MEADAGVELSKAVGREAALFENESDVAGFLQRAARAVVAHSGVRYCAVYLAEPSRQALRPIAASGQPPRSDPGGAVEALVLQAFRERAVRRTADGGGGLRLAVPIALGSERIGALELHFGQGYAVGSEEEAVLRAVASQLAAVLQNASALLEAREPRGKGGMEVIRGEGASGGVAVGRALLYEAGFEPGPPDPEEAEADPEEAEAEAARFQHALELTRRQVEELARTESPLSDVLSLIFSAHLLMLNDEAFTGAMRERIRGGSSPRAAVCSVVNGYALQFSRTGEARIAEKAQDVRDLGYRLLRNLVGAGEEQSDYRGLIALARHLFPSDLVRLAAQRIEGLVLFGGTLTAHLSILASSLLLPVLVSRDPRLLQIPPETPLLLVASLGELRLGPPEELERQYRLLRPAGDRRAPDAGGAPAAGSAPAAGAAAGGRQAATAQAATADGTRIRLLANVNLYMDALLAAERGAEGIGLYRSEFPFIIRNDFLSEDEQAELYGRIMAALPSGPVLLRTADIGGDKLMQGRQEERNPFLGVRGIRFSLANRELFREQLRAMLRAGQGRQLGIMLPMVSTLEEVEEARAELGLCLQALREEGLPHNPAPRLGAMVELPSAVMDIEELARATDFLSIGTNDLIMYLLAVDRTNERLGPLYRSHHPTVLRSIAQVAAGVGDKLGELSVCGDSAADPLMIPFLLGVGIRSLSVAPARIDAVREFLGRLAISEAQEMAGRMLAIRKVREMEAYLRELARRLPTPGAQATAAGQEQ
jgi:phosphotransferase system enzyme I (PtsP)